MAKEDNTAKKTNSRKRKIDEIKKADFSKRQIGLFNKVTELSILCKAKTALIVTSPNNELYACGYPNCDAVIQKFMTGKDTMQESEQKKQEEIVENLRLEYEAIQEEEKNLRAITDEEEKNGSIFRCWWNDSIDDMSLESLENFKTSLEKLRLNLSSAEDGKKLMATSNLSHCQI